MSRPVIEIVPHAAGAPPNAARMPAWIRQPLGDARAYGGTAQAVHGNRLHTVCEEARCPNRGECWGRGTATFMLLGDICTRACGFCSVKTGRPVWLDADEPRRVAQAVRALGLRYAVLTSVNRDDLGDGGAGVFAATLDALRRQDPGIGVEFLTPDFQHKQDRAVAVIESALDAVSPELAAHTRLVWGHNIETVPQLYRSVRKGARYDVSLALLWRAASIPGVEAKSALMLGLGETPDQVVEVLRDLRAHDVTRIALGQYLRPTRDSLPVLEYVHPDQFAEYADEARRLGFSWVKAGPLVRSSYHAEELQV